MASVFTADDYRCMALALNLARRGRCTTDPNPNVGCVIVAADGNIVGEGWHARAGEAHAEVLALQQAREQSRGATVYVTLEPCSHHGRTPPCADALIAAKVAKVICAMQDPNPQVAGRGLQMLQEAGIETVTGLLESAAANINRGFCKRMQTGRPWVTVKIAASLDGRTAMESGESKWITSAEARADVHRLRAGSAAIMSGIGTVLADDPQLTARCSGSEVIQPLRVVLDSALRIESQAKVIGEPGELVVYHCAGDGQKVRALEGAGVTVKKLPGADGKVDLAAVMTDLGRQEINNVLVEAGATINGALLEAGLVDEVVVYQAARIMGKSAKGMFALASVETMAQSIELVLADTRRLGPDLRLTYQVE